MRRFVSLAGLSLALLAGLLVVQPAALASECPVLVTDSQGEVGLSPAPAPGVDWRGCDLSFLAGLSPGPLVGVDLSGANLSGAYLGSVDFSGADLRGTNFERADINWAQFDGADASEALFNGAGAWEGVSMRGTNLAGASFIGFGLGTDGSGYSGNFTGANVTDVDFDGASLYTANFDDATVTGAQFGGADVYPGDGKYGGVPGTKGCRLSGTPTSLPSFLEIIDGCFTLVLPPDTTPPSMYLEPDSDGTYSAPMELWATALDTAPWDAHNEFLVGFACDATLDGAKIDLQFDGSDEGRWASRSALLSDPGLYEISCTATDEAGLTGSKSLVLLLSSPPSAPTGVVATKDVTAKTATISWKPPASDGRSMITGYRVARDAGSLPGANPWSTTVSATTRSFTFKVLTPGSTYTLSVQAFNTQGTGPAASAQVTMVLEVPSAPTAFAISKIDANRTATITWQPPISSGGSPITGYRVARDAGTVPGQGPWSTTVSATTRSFTFKVLVVGSTYTLSVQAINAQGTGPAASGKVTIAPTTVNLLQNPGFELDANADNRPDNWTSNAKFTRSATSIYTGSYAGRHRATDNLGHTVSQTVVSLSAGTGYRFAGRVNIPATSDAFTFQIRVRWINSAGALIRTDVIRRYTVSTGGWTEATGTMVSPTGTVKAQVQMVSTNLNATIYVDDFIFGRT